MLRFDRSHARSLSKTTLRRLVAFVASLVAFAAALSPSHAADSDFETWLPIVATGPISGNLRTWLEFQPRFGDDSTALDRFIVRPAIGYSLPRGFTTYVGYIYQPVLETNDFRYNWKNEHRPYQELRHDERFESGLSLQNRFRFEQRFIDGTGGGAALRSRYLLRAMVPIDTERGLAFAAGNELFINMNGTDRGPRSGFDQDRVNVGLAITDCRNVTYELGYMNNYVQLPRRIDRLNQVVYFSTTWKWD